MKPEEQLLKLSLEQKAALCVGMNFWMTQDFPHAEIPSLFLSDGPHGLRKQDVGNSDHLGINESSRSVCYPTACAAACTWDRELIEEMGEMLGREARQAGVDVLLGPGVNIKRSALCGRNFEYYSEDPYLAGEMAAALIRGIQRSPVSACVKHFAANNQENRRKAINAVMDARTLREIYLPAFEAAVTKGDVQAVMTSYNKINGDYTAQSPQLATHILREQWGFDGILMTDWGGMDQIVPSIAAGLSLQMPGNDGSSAQKLIDAVRDGRLEERKLDDAVLSILRVIHHLQATPEAVRVTPDACHEMAVKVAENAMVLLKNQDRLLPVTMEESIAVIGQMAVSPRYQGGGSSHVNPYRVSCALEEMRKRSAKIFYAPGYQNEQTNDALVDEAASLAASCDKVILFIGLPDSFESETYDRENLDMPEAYGRLVSALAKANPNLIVVLSNGSVVSMPWLAEAGAILETYLAGEGSGEAVCRVIFGEVNPSGKLAETFIRRIEDSPVWIGMTDGTDHSDRCTYQEGVFVGYRYYEKKKTDVSFCFGHGLSYTTFSYSNLTLDRVELSDQDTLTVSVTVTNTGDRYGKEVIQVYVGRVAAPVPAPVKELRAFEKLGLAPGASACVTFRLSKRAFAYYNETLEDWYVPEGKYQIYVGSSLEDIRCEQTVLVHPTVPWQPKVTRNTILKDILEDDHRFAVFEEKYREIKPYLPFGLSELDLNTDPFARGLLNNMTLHSLASYVGAHLTDGDIEELVRRMNESSNAPGDDSLKR